MAYRVLGPSGLSLSQMMGALRVSIYEGIAATIFTNLVSGIFFVGLARYMGANYFQLGLLVAIPALTNLSQLFASYFILERLKARKWFVITLFGVYRVLWCSIIFIPLLFPQDQWVRLFLFFFFLSSLCNSLALPAWQGWIRDLVPEALRLRYFSLRNIIFSIIALVISIVGGHVVDWKWRFLEGGYAGFFILYVLALAFAILSVVLFLFQWENPPRVSGERVRFLEYLKSPLKEKRLLMFSSFIALWTFAAMFPGQFFVVFMTENLQLKYSLVAIFIGLFTVTAVLTSRFWAYLCDKYGNLPIMKLSAFVMAFLPILWIFNTRQYYFGIPFIYAASGIFMVGINLSSYNLLLELVPQRRASIYFGFHLALTGLAAFLGPTISGYLAERWADFHLILGGFEIVNLQVIFFISGCLIFISMLFFPRIEERGEVGVKYLVWQFVSHNPLAYFYHLFLFSRHEEEKVYEASKAFGKLRAGLAVPELVEALNDPNPWIRKQAARSLGEIGDKRAVPALIKKLNSPEDGVQLQAATALGKIKSEVSLRALLAALGEAKDRQLKESILVALGRLGNRKARGSLREVLDNLNNKEEEKELIPIIIEVLAGLGERKIIRRALAAIPEYSSKVIKRQLQKSVAKALGIDNYYQIIFLDEYNQLGRLTKLLKGMEKYLLRRKEALAKDAFIKQGLDMAISFYQDGKAEEAIYSLYSLFLKLKKLSEKDFSDEEAVFNYVIQKSSKESLYRSEIVLFILVFERVVRRV